MGSPNTVLVLETDIWDRIKVGFPISPPPNTYNNNTIISSIYSVLHRVFLGVLSTVVNEKTEAQMC